MYRRVILLIFLPVIFLPAQQSQLYTLEPLIVTASKIPTTLLSTNRNITVIEQEEINNSSASSVADLLESVSSVYIKKGGAQGLQADVSIRGGTFEQTLILIDGAKVNDPQTGHFNLNLPIELEDIDRIEILKGPASRLYGPDAFSGVINIITKKEETKSLRLKALMGYHRLLEGNVSLSGPIVFSLNRLSVSGRHSDGYTYNTDFDVWNLLLNSNINQGDFKAEISLGYKDKEYGANCFYSNLAPNAWDHIKTAFIKSGINFNKYSISFNWRRHEDDYILDKEDTSLYRNRSTTNIGSIALQSTISSKIGSSVIGVDVDEEKIRSENLGNRSRIKSGLFLEHNLPKMKKMTIVFGSNFSYYSDWGWFFYPGIEVGLKLNKRTNLYAAAEKAFRVPTYTELYLVSPTNVGNPELDPEKASSYEIGIKIVKGSTFTNFNIFMINEYNTIDWVRADTNDAWSATNSEKVSINGLEISTSFNPIVRMYKKIPIPNITLGYSFTGVNKEESSLQSKYLLTHPRHRLTMKIDYELTSSLRQNWMSSYEYFPESEGVFLLDTRISWQRRNIELFISVTNLLNTEYTEAGYIPMPGRWAKVGMRVGIK